MLFVTTVGVEDRVSGMSSLDLLVSLLQPAPAYVPPANEAMLAWEQQAAIGSGFWILGSLTFLMGCVLAVAQACSSIRWAGLQMLAGSLVATAGISSFCTTFTVGPATFGAELGPGVVLSLVASGLALVKFVAPGEQDHWARAIPPANSVAYTTYLNALRQLQDASGSRPSCERGTPTPEAGANPPPSTSETGSQDEV